MRRSIKEDLLSLIDLIDANAPSCDNHGEEVAGGGCEPIGGMDCAPDCDCEHCVLVRIHDRLSEIEKAVTT